MIAFDDDTAIVEVANTCGLATLPGGVLAPMTASSYGFGEAIRAALTLARTRLVLALGGSASTDGGIGMLAALGYRFLDPAGHLLAPTAENLNLIHRVDSSGAVDVGGIDLIVAGDVTSPLLGLTGAAAVFGPQKGATAAQVAQLDTGLANLGDRRRRPQRPRQRHRRYTIRRRLRRRRPHRRRHLPRSAAHRRTTAPHRNPNRQPLHTIAVSGRAVAIDELFTARRHRQNSPDKPFPLLASTTRKESPPCGS